MLNSNIARSGENTLGNPAARRQNMLHMRNTNPNRLSEAVVDKTPPHTGFPTEPAIAAGGWVEPCWAVLRYRLFLRSVTSETPAPAHSHPPIERRFGRIKNMQGSIKLLMQDSLSRRSTEKVYHGNLDGGPWVTLCIEGNLPVIYGGNDGRSAFYCEGMVLLSASLTS